MHLIIRARLVRFLCVPLILVLVMGQVQQSFAEEDVADQALLQELESVRARIAEREEKVEQAAAERWRLRHGVKYGEDDVIPLRLEAREVQRALLDVRTQLTDHLRIHHPEYREQQRDIGRTYESLRALREQKEIISRELALAARGARAGALLPKDAAALEEELESVELRIESLAAEAHEKAVALNRAREEWAERDNTGRGLLEEERALQEEFNQATRRLNEAVDARPEMARFEAQRVRMVAELDTLRRREEELKRALSTEGPAGYVTP